MPFDPARLFSQLQNTGLANKDNPQYQLLDQIIRFLKQLNDALISLGIRVDDGSNSGNTIINQLMQSYDTGSSNSDDSNFEYYSPGIQGSQGLRGRTGSDGFPGVDGLDGIDGVDGLSGPQGLRGIVGDAGPRGIAGPQGLSIDGLDGEDGFVILPGDRSVGDGYLSPNIPRKNGTNAFTGNNTFSGITSIVTQALNLAIGQIKFPVTPNLTSDPTTLDDYEEGTFTPVDNSGAALVFSSTTGEYIKIGQLVVAALFVNYPITINGANASIGGLPFSSRTTANAVYAGAVGFINIGIQPFALILSNSSSIYLTNNSAAQFTNAQFSNAQFVVVCIYRSQN